MHSKSFRLDRFISKKQGISLRAVRNLLASGTVCVNGEPARDVAQIINQFDVVVVCGEVLQKQTPLYFMLNKPKGVVCATKDKLHKTVLDLIDHPQKSELHIVGRLDLNSTGLVLLTNDGAWSKQLMEPSAKVSKVYQVQVQHPITPEYVVAFKQGMYFDYEDVYIKPVELIFLSPHKVELVLTEGKYHQIKRMFGRFRNPVLALHRSAVGPYVLDEGLLAGQYQALTPVSY